ncbi:unnamed protein product [Cuscuta campestris]|uniref:Late embryogenesis abundant protein LEA-2 subgroup domain-containing protein n=1 Tax=Cuscuta campestris TaxID=132261 RepID=A0A484LRR7_9ASTE|nr:unnamed protein product [Cuscuta campestris]
MDAAESGMRRRKHRCSAVCCGVATAIVITVAAAVLVVLAFTVFRVRDPKIRMESIQIDGLSSLTAANPVDSNLNVTLSARLAVKNPNAVSFKFDRTTTSLVYDGRVVGEAEAPPGNARARRTMTLTVTVNVMVRDLLAGAPSLSRDLIARRMPASMSTTIRGRAKVLIIKKSVTVRMNCSMVLNLSSQDIDDLDCNKKRVGISVKKEALVNFLTDPLH